MTGRNSAAEVFGAFARLGLHSFGGPIAHLGYFRREFVERRAWVSEEQYAQLIALCQFLPGPASSQVGFALGLQRAGWLGALAAFIGFTLPSACLLVAFAALEASLSGPLARGAVAGLKLAAVCVVAHAVVGMAKQLTPDLRRRALAAAVVIASLLISGAWTQLAVIVVGGAFGYLFCGDSAATPPAQLSLSYGRRIAAASLAIFAALLACSLWLTTRQATLIDVLAGFYRAGALVFGGAHVVLPLLEDAVVGPELLSSDQFLAGYGAAQAIPGPMFSLSAYLGMKLGGGVGAVLCLAAMFLPGFLALVGTLPFWAAISSHAGARSALAGVNAAVVGIVAAALYDPVWVSAVSDAVDAGVAAVGFAALATGRVSPLWAVAWCVTASALRVFV